MHDQEDVVGEIYQPGDDVAMANELDGEGAELDVTHSGPATHLHTPPNTPTSLFLVFVFCLPFCVSCTVS